MGRLDSSVPVQSGRALSKILAQTATFLFRFVGCHGSLGCHDSTGRWVLLVSSQQN